MEKLQVGLGERSYPIWIGEGILDRLGEALREAGFPRRVAVVTNDTVEALYAKPVLEALRSADYTTRLLVLPDGEEYKNLDTLNSLFDALIENGVDRGWGLIALGGGVIGDMAGFAAATYLRGIPFSQIPTTLLAQVDSSVGGKTGVNHRLGKNLIGAFYQPRLVLIDVETLQTLPVREFSAGMAEVIKYGAIRDRAFFSWLQAKAADLQALDAASLIAAVRTSCQIKADIVEIDEKEGSLRAILNYGHTFGHAVEVLSGYGEYKHGEAVAIGMVVASRVSVELGLSRKEQAEQIRELLMRFSLPVTPPKFPLDDFLRAMGRDKKVKEGVLRLILNKGIGDCLIHPIDRPEDIFAPVLNQLGTQG